jgi:glucose dehydrogenase
MIKYIILFYSILFNSYADNNYYFSDFTKDDLKLLKKTWIFKSNIYKDTQTKPVAYEDKLIYLDGYKNLRVLSLINGKQICINSGKKDRGYHRGVGIYKKSKNEVYAVFVRHGSIILIDINNCNERKVNVKNISNSPISAPIYINKNIAYVLPNGGVPFAIDLSKEKILWEASIQNSILKKLKHKNMNQNIKWDVWGGGAIDMKYNQLVFSTANPKPSWHSKSREGPNLFYNSIVSIDLSTGVYKWHFQEIEHDLWNLDLAAPPILLSLENMDYVAQATKTGQLILLNRKNGKPTEKIYETYYDHKDNNENTFSIFRNFPDWLKYSRKNFNKNDINNLDQKFKLEAEKKINTSNIGDYIPLNEEKKFIYYGIHGGTQWPGIASTPGGVLIIPSNNIPFRVKLKNTNEFNFKYEFHNLYKEILNLEFRNISVFKKTLKKVFNRLENIFNYKKPQLEKWEKFINLDGIPLNKPPWGILVAIDVANKEKKWIVPHGSYSSLKNMFLEKPTGSEIFGSPVILSTGIIFMAGTDDKMLRAYELENGNQIWDDELPFSSYGNLIVANYNKRQFLIVNSSSGSNFNSSSGDAIVAYELSKN